MKIFKYISLFFILLLIIFFSLGLLVRTLAYSNRITVNATAAKSFELFCDTSLMKKWIPGFVSLTVDSGKANVPGCRYKLVLQQDDDQYEMWQTLEKFTPGEQYSYLLENDVLTNHVDVRFKKEGNYTTVTASNSVQGKNILWQSVFVMLKGKFRKQGEVTFDQLKGLIENNAQ